MKREPKDDPVLTREELMKLARFMKIMAELPDPEIFNWGPGRPIIVDVKVYTGGNTWATKPGHFEIDKSTFTFRNQSEKWHLKLTFESEDVSVEPATLVMGPLTTGKISVGKGVCDVAVTCYRSKTGAADDWSKALQRTGNGADTKINNP